LKNGELKSQGPIIIDSVYRILWEGFSPSSRFKITREGHGRQVSVTVSTGNSATDWMKRRVDSKLGKQIYSHRMSVVEPVFGNIGTNKRLNRFSLRGKEKVQGQWRLFCLVHNIEKVMRYGAMAA
jgi:hypothetical protein